MRAGGVDVALAVWPAELGREEGEEVAALERALEQNDLVGPGDRESDCFAGAFGDAGSHPCLNPEMFPSAQVSVGSVLLVGPTLLDQVSEIICGGGLVTLTEDV